MLAVEGMPNDALETITLLTHKEDIPYLEYLESLKDNGIARKVKLADLKHNSDLSRLTKVSEEDLVCVRKYSEAVNLLHG